LSEPWSQVYERIRAQFAEAVPTWVEGISLDVERIAGAPGNREHLESLFRRLHDLAGSCGTYGFRAISSLADEALLVCRRALDSGAALGEGDVDRLRRMVRAVREELRSDRSTPP
jgi:chemotaxis protein histidine kinase CheA